MTIRGRALKNAALPSDHGSWVFLLSPLLIGLFAGGRLEWPAIYLTVAALAAFLARHPLTLAVRVYSGRRSREELPAIRFWVTVYSLIGLLHVAGLVMRGFGYLLYLAIPGVPVFLWYLFLVSRRAERRQTALELLATGALALAAPAGLWVGLGRPAPEGWLLWGLTWGQSAGSILHAYMRLEQRQLSSPPAWGLRWRMGRAALAFNLAVLAAVGVLAGLGRVPGPLLLPYAVQSLETLRGLAAPAVGYSPRSIGLRQLFVSTLFTVLFILAWGQ